MPAQQVGNMPIAKEIFELFQLPCADKHEVVTLGGGDGLSEGHAIPKRPVDGEEAGGSIPGSTRFRPDDVSPNFPWRPDIQAP